MASQALEKTPSVSDMFGFSNWKQYMDTYNFVLYIYIYIYYINVQDR